MPPYDPDVIERFAARLERRAVAVRRGCTVAGAVLGALFGAVPLTPLAVAWPVPHLFGFTTLAVGLGVGALIGYVVGDGRAEIYRLHAQTTLCQLHAQRTSLAIWRFLQQRPAAAQAPAAAPAAAPVAPPAPAPRPEPVVRREPEPLPAPQPLPERQPEPEPELVPAFQREAVRLASVPAPPSVLRPAGIPSPPISPPPLTG